MRKESVESISVIIPTYNEEDNVADAIVSVSWASEIIVVDAFSEDDTVRVAEAHGAKVLQHEYKGPAAQKNWALQQTSYDKVLLLDADERITAALRQELISILEYGMEYAAYWIPRQSYFMGRKIRFSGWQNDAVIRLIDKRYCRYPDVRVHEEIETDGKVGRMKNKMEHYTYRSLHDYLSKVDRYTTWGAYDRLPKAGNISLYHLGIKPVFRFFKSYILNLGILDGMQGFVIASFSAYTVFLRSLKIWRIRNGEDPDLDK